MPRLPIVAASVALVGCANIVGLGPELELVFTTASGAGGDGGVGGGGGGGSSGAGGGGGNPFACTGDIVWARQLGDGSDQYAGSLAVGANGHVFLAGVFAGDLEIDRSTITSAGGTDLFLASFDADGNLRWMKPFGDELDHTGPIFLAPTLDGGVVLAGAFGGTIDFGDAVPHTAFGEDAFVARFSEAGTNIWSKVFQSPDAFEKVIDVVVDPSTGDVVVGGAFETQIDVGGAGPLPSGVNDGFVARFDGRTGDHLWSKAIGGTGAQFVESVDVDARGRMVFGGHSTSSVDVGTGPLPSQGDGYDDSFIALYDSSDDPVWAKAWPSPGIETLTRVRFTTDGFAIGGDLIGTLAFEGEAPIQAGDGLFVAKLDATGGLASSLAFQNMDHIRAFAVDGDKTLVAAQFTFQTASDHGPINAVGKVDGLALELTAAVDYAWTLPIGSLDDDDAHGIAVDAASNVYVAAHFHDEVIVPECGTFTNHGGWDILLLKRSP